MRYLLIVLAALCARLELSRAYIDIPIPGWNLLDEALNELLPKLVGQKPNNENGTASVFKPYLLQAQDDVALDWMTLQELIASANFKYEDYKAVADDGYITSLTRIVNPLADRHKLKWPPVLLLHGGTIDPTAYVFASTKKHHPEKWPRARNEPTTSWNRSLALMLANHGYDVWLAETRGSNERNIGHLHFEALRSALTNKNADKNMTFGENIQSIFTSFNYWSFSQDDIIEHEIKSYIDKICQVVAIDVSPQTAANNCKVSLLAFSLSTPLALGFLSTRPDYAKEKIHRVILMAPTFYKKGVSPLLKFGLTKICPFIPNSIGTMIVFDFVFVGLRKIVLLPAFSKKIRYTIVKPVTTLLMGPSAKYNTFIEQNVLHHLMRAFGFKQGKQMCQQMKENRLQKYDYGSLKNMQVYNQTEPPEYDISNLFIKPYLMVNAENDIVGTPKSVAAVIKRINPKPHRHIVAPSFNHLDLVAGVENDKFVNRPILEFLDEFALDWPVEYHPKENKQKHSEPKAKTNSKQHKKHKPLFNYKLQ